MKYKYPILLFLFALSLVASAILSFTPIPEFCDPGKGCDIVQNSSYAKTFGIENSVFGIGIFSFLILITFLQILKPNKYKKQIIFTAVVIGSITSIYFIYIQHFVLNAYCKYFLVVDFSLLIALGIIILNWKN